MLGAQMPVEKSPKAERLKAKTQQKSHGNLMGSVEIAGILLARIRAKKLQAKLKIMKVDSV
jgi:hypothetical protein